MESFIVGDEIEIINKSESAPSTAFVIVESEKGFMLLYNKHYYHWEIAGGYMEHYESPKECSIRECKEESNQNLTDLIFIGVAKYKLMNAAIYYSFLFDEEEFIENDEISGMRWWKPFEDINDSVDAESMKLIDIYISSRIS